VPLVRVMVSRMFDTKGESSPDRGNRSIVFNAAGDVSSLTDARGKTHGFTYDVERRLTAITYPTGTASTFEYDGGPTPVTLQIGNLTKITDESGSTTYVWDAMKRLTSKTQTTNAKAFVQTYSYVSAGAGAGQLANTVLPGKTRVNFVYDAQGRVSAITLNPVDSKGASPNLATTIGILSAVSYSPTGKVVGWTWGDGTAYARTFDQFDRLTSYPLGNEAGTGAASGVRRTLSYTTDGLVQQMTHAKGGVAQAGLDQTFTYDLAGRLRTASVAGVNYGYGLDVNTNRDSETIGGTGYTNVIAASSNRMTSDGAPTGTSTLGYDAAGNVLTDGFATYTYSDRGRMTTAAVSAGTVAYKYNAFEQRASNTGPAALVPGGAAYYVYEGLAGRLVGEYDANLVPVSETIYLGAMPVAVLKYTRTGSKPYTWTMTVSYVYADQIDTPRLLVRNSDHAIQWRWDSAEPFGATVPNQNPNGLGAFVFNQRFPGQIYDPETGNFHNWHRDYSPRTGRYVQSDPIGLAGGDQYLHIRRWGSNQLKRSAWACHLQEWKLVWRHTVLRAGLAASDRVWRQHRRMGAISNPNRRG
jgi:RHS repeat-associated protein